MNLASAALAAAHPKTIIDSAWDKWRWERAVTVDTTSHLRKEALVGGVSNTLFNGLIAWLLLRGGPALGWSGQGSFVVDLLATGFLLPFIVALIVIPLQRRKLAAGSLAPMSLAPDHALQRWVNHMPAGTLGNALLFGLAGACLVTPPTLALLHLAGVQSIAPLPYALFKGIWAGLLAALLVIPMVLVALRAATAQRRTT